MRFLLGGSELAAPGEHHSAAPIAETISKPSSFVHEAREQKPFEALIGVESGIQAVLAN